MAKEKRLTDMTMDELRRHIFEMLVSFEMAYSFKKEWDSEQYANKQKDCDEMLPKIMAAQKEFAHRFAAPSNVYNLDYI